MGEDEDRSLLSSLGVTSANPEDIERDVLEEAKINGGEGSELAGSTEEEPPESSEYVGAKLLNKLRAVEFEINAVASTVVHTRDNSGDHGDGDFEEGKNVEDKGVTQLLHGNTTLQHALATDRLRSLKKTKAQLERELTGLSEASTSGASELNKVVRDIVREEPRLKRKLKEIRKPSRNQDKKHKIVSFNDDADFDAVLDAASAGFVETERDELVRKGILTPFHSLKGFERRLKKAGTSNRPDVPARVNDDHVSATVDRLAQSISEASQARPSTKLLDAESLPKLDGPTFPFQRIKAPVRFPNSSGTKAKKNKDSKTIKNRPSPGKKWRNRLSREETHSETEVADVEVELDEVEDIAENELPHVAIEGGLKIPETIFSKLFDYQKVGVQWLWELHCQKAGGIIGDEMGLGKTVQVLSFLGALHFSNMYKPSIVVCPVTLLRQWKREAKRWYPRCHVELLHDSAQDLSRKKKQTESSESDYDSDSSLNSDNDGKSSLKSVKRWDPLINRVLRSESGLLITTYEQVRLLGEKLLDIEWGYAILDEGHRIRNPNAEVTLVCKQLQTVHRIIMTGAPIQNKLTELWSLFDFVFPGKLGVLPVFEAEFAVPISVGGYANASPLQVSTAYRCAVVLRDLIMPYLLRRMKADVNAHLPKKTEHVLFCSLTVEQRSVYRAFLASSDVEQILGGSRNSLYGIDVMRKICNHPDLLEREHAAQNPDYGNPGRSGKMKVVAEILKVWNEQGHRVLLFSQTQQMLDILESFLIKNDYSYRRMDGLTPVKQRMALIDEFNNSNEVFIFILTTKVGGLGTNLTGADRVMIFDPDWNPSNDIQARERAWRIGQKRDVTVYRLITRGTIEEKVYHRQIYKHFLTNKILKNPQQKRFFKARELKDLFTLNDDEESGSTETSHLFSQLSGDVNLIGVQNNEQDEKNHSKASSADDHAGNGKRSSNAGPSKRKAKEKEKGDRSDGELDEETNILKSLFNAQGIHSAVDHDLIMNASEEEKIRLEEKASQVAQKAAEALRQSRMLRNEDDISVPTWTGKSGAAGAPSSIRKKFGSTMNSQLMKSSEGLSSNGVAAGVAAGKALSSAELLARIRGNQERAVGAGHENQSAGAASGSINRGRTAVNGHSRSPHTVSSIQPEVLIRQICTFIQRRGGSSDSASIVEHFKDKIPPKDLPVFKNLLKEIATLEKDTRGSYWVLKSDYHDH